MTHIDAQFTQWCQQMGIPAQFVVDPGNATVRSAVIAHMGLNGLTIVLDRDQFVQFVATVGRVPSTSPAPLFRQMLAQNSGSAYGQYCILEAISMIRFQHVMRIPDLSFPTFQTVLNGFCGNVLGLAMPLKMQFQIPNA